MKNKTLFYIGGCFLIILSVLLGTVFLADKEHSRDDTILKVSWMSSWATAGQIMTSLIHTSIPQTFGLRAEFPVFLFGPEMNEAAMAGSVNVTNTGIVPTANLLAASDDWVVVARLIYFEVSLVVPNGSQMKTIDDLRGKRIGVPFGGGSHPYVLQRLAEHGLQQGVENDAVELVNIDPSEQVTAFMQGSVDAIATWEPQTALALDRASGRVLDSDVHVGFITVRKSFAENYPDQVVALLISYIHANHFVAQNRELTDRWFSEVSRFEPDLIERIKVIEPNMSSGNVDDVDIWLNDRDIERSQTVINVMHEHDLVRGRVDLKERTDFSYLEKALEELSDEEITERKR